MSALLSPLLWSLGVSLAAEPDVAAPAPAPGTTVEGPRSPPSEPAPPAPPVETPLPPTTHQGPRTPPPPDERPLAIPADRWNPSAVDDARAAAIRAYRARHLAIRSWSELRSTTVYSDLGYGLGYGYGYPYGGYGSVTVGMPWFWSEERWSVYRGPQRLSNPQYLDLVGRGDEAQALERRIRGNRTATGLLYGVAGAGGAATVASLFGMDNAHTLRAWEDWRIVGVAGLTSVFVGAVSGSFPAARARRLAADPMTIRSWDELSDEIAGHNEALRVDLGLSADDALKIEAPR